MYTDESRMIVNYKRYVFLLAKFCIDKNVCRMKTALLVSIRFYMPRYRMCFGKWKHLEKQGFKTKLRCGEDVQWRAEWELHLEKKSVTLKESKPFDGPGFSKDLHFVNEKCGLCD